MARYLIIRLSAMGDVAMLIPLLYAVARANEQHEFILLTQPFFTELLLDAPDNVEGMAIDIRRGEERSFLGLLRYARRLRHEHFDAVLDLHDVLRTKVLRSILRLTGVPTQHLIKPREGRRRLVADSATKDLTPLPPMWSLYQQVFRSAGLSVPEAIPPVAIHPTLRATFERLHPELTQPTPGPPRADSAYARPPASRHSSLRLDTGEDLRPRSDAGGAPPHRGERALRDLPLR